MNKQEFKKLITADSVYRFRIAGGKHTAYLRHYTFYSDLKDICDFPKPKAAKNLLDYYGEPEKDVLILEIDFSSYRIKNRSFKKTKAEICEKIKEYFSEMVLRDCKAISNGHFPCLQED